MIVSADAEVATPPPVASGTEGAAVAYSAHQDMHDALRVSRPLDRAPEHSLGPAHPHWTCQDDPARPLRCQPDPRPATLQGRPNPPCSQAGGRRHIATRSRSVAPSPCRRARPTPDRKISPIGTTGYDHHAGRFAEASGRRGGETPPPACTRRCATSAPICGARDFFADPRPGPKTAPGKDAARARIIELRAQGHSIDEIATVLAARGHRVEPHRDQRGDHRGRAAPDLAPPGRRPRRAPPRRPAPGPCPGRRGLPRR